MSVDSIGAIADKIKDDTVLLCAVAKAAFLGSYLKRYYRPEFAYFEKTAWRSLSAMEIELLSRGGEISAPVLLLPTEAKQHGVPPIYIPRNEYSFPLRNYISYWRRFYTVSSLQSDFFKQVVTDAIPAAVAQLPNCSPVDLIDRLWKERWFIGGLACGVVRFEASSHGMVEKGEPTPRTFSTPA
jgi:hypothetical protein